MTHNEPLPNVEDKNQCSSPRLPKESQISREQDQDQPLEQVKEVQLEQQKEQEHTHEQAQPEDGEIKSLRDKIIERILYLRRYGRKPKYDDLLGTMSITKGLKIVGEIPHRSLPEVEVELEGEDLEYYKMLNDVDAPIGRRSARRNRSSPQKRKYAAIDDDSDSDSDSDSDAEKGKLTVVKSEEDINYKPPTYLLSKYVPKGASPLPNGEKRKVGRPRKDPAAVASPAKVKKEKKEKPPKIPLYVKKKNKLDIASGFISTFPDDNEHRQAEDEISDSETKFIFHKDLIKSPKRGLTRYQRYEISQKVQRSDVFSSPQKQRSGIIQLVNPTELTPSKKGILTLVNGSPSKTPNGRSGSPRKVQKQKLQDQSARKRANRTLYSKLLEDGVNDDSDDESNVAIAEKIILDSKDDSKASTPFVTPRKLKPNQLPTNDPSFVPTPLPTLDQDEAFFDEKFTNPALFLDGTDGYFDQHRAKPRLSLNSMVQAPSLNYDEFNSLILFSGYLHHEQKESLISSYRDSFMQWLFELKEGFNLVFYGIGSKRSFLLSFVEDFLFTYIDAPAVVINGYNSAINLKDILNQIISTLKVTKVPKKYNEAIEYLIEYFKRKPKGTSLILLIHNIDGESLRDEKIQSYISRISSIEQINLICSIDHINAPLLWDSVRLSNFNFVWHNVTNFTEYITEISFHDPLSLGQTQSSAGSKGAKYVLSSLTNSSRSLYRVLASNQLQNMEDEILEKANKQQTVADPKGTVKHALEFNHFFHLCAEEFISSNEINFRTMLMEFVEHKMAVLTKDASGTEQVFIPFSSDEISKLLEDELL